MSRIRRIVFVLFLLVYLIACPLTVLYALGYVFEPGETEELMKTGAISVSTLPPGASVYLERRRYTKATPTLLRGLRPGDYHLRLVAKGYEPWVGTVAVDAEKATPVEKILLAPRSPRRETLLPEAFEELLPVPETPFLLLAKGPKLKDLVVYDMERREDWPLVPAELPLGNDPALVLATARGSRFVMLRVRAREGERLVGLELKRGDSRLTDLTTLFPAKPTWIGWDPHAAKQLFTVFEGAVNQLDLEAMAIFPKVADRVRGWGVVSNALVVLTEDAAIERISREGKRTERLFDPSTRAPVLAGGPSLGMSPQTSRGVVLSERSESKDEARGALSLSGGLHAPATGRALFGAKSLFRITGLPGDRLLFFGERGELLISRGPARAAAGGPTRLLEEGARGFEFDPPTERLLVWRRDRLGIADLSAAKMGEAEVPPPSIRWIVRDARDVQQAFWVYEGSHFLFRDRDAVMLCAFDPQGHPTLRRLLQVRPRSAIAYLEDGGRLFYLDRETGRLSSMDILP